MTAEPSEDLLAEVRLASVRGVGPLLRKRLVAALGDASAVLCADTATLCGVEGVGPAIARSILTAPGRDEARATLSEASDRGIRPLTPRSGEYPPALREIYDPPPVLYCRGSILPTDRRAVAIVGTRRATRYALRQAELLAAGLARAGVTVISGLARGVDAAAHRGAIAAGGRTIASMAGGLLRIYPPEHDRLADEVANHGALLAEAPPSAPPLSGSFPQRNRIISGLSLGVVVIEAAVRSGALITARHAAEQGRDVFALPGQVDNPQSLGCLRLLQEGAKLVVTVDDILEELPHHEVSPFAGRRSDPEPAIEWPEPERTVLGHVSDDPIDIDALVASTGLPVERVLAALSRLEAAGALRRVSGVRVALA